MSEHNIKNALEFRNSNENFMKKEKGILMKKTIYELRKIKCYGIETTVSHKKSICVSRSFGKKIYEYEYLEKALNVYVHKAVLKLIKNKSFCRSITIFIKTSRYSNKPYSNFKTHNLLESTSDLRIIWRIAKDILKYIYLESFPYNKVGIILSDFSYKKEIQQSLMNRNQNHSRKNQIEIMKVVENINTRFGEGKLRLSSNSDHLLFFNKNTSESKWQMKSDFRSACYTTNWCDIPKVKVK